MTGDKVCVWCGGKAVYSQLQIKTAWGEGPSVEVKTRGWKCEDCSDVVFDARAVREIQQIAHYHYRKGRPELWH